MADCICGGQGVITAGDWLGSGQPNRMNGNVINNSNQSSNVNANTNTNVAAASVAAGYRGKRRSEWVVFFLCLFLGWAGAHKFYDGKIGMGILYMLTVGLCGIGCLIDLIFILGRPNPYYV